MPRKGENIFKRMDGRWEGRYIKERRSDRPVYGYVFGKSYREVKEKKAAAIAALPAPVKELSFAKEQPLLRDIGVMWLNDVRSTRKKSTTAKYQNQLQNHILPYFGDIHINSITNHDIIEFTQNLFKSKKLSSKTVTDILSSLKSIRKFAIIHGYDVGFIPDCVTIPRDAEEIRVLSFLEEASLIRYLREHPDFTSLGILLCLFTGLRVGELCALKWSDISLEQQELRVKRTMQRIQNLDGDSEKKTYIEIDTPKSKSSIRTIPIPDTIMDDLRAAYKEDAYLLTGHSSLFVEPRTLENRFKIILNKCGIADATVHTCRHSYATRCIEAGFDIKSLSEMLGHANVSITLNRYVHPSMQHKHANVKKLADLFAVK